MDNKTKVACTTLKVAFLMQHQHILPDLKDIIAEIEPPHQEGINMESPEYLAGAYDALMNLISQLEKKG